MSEISKTGESLTNEVAAAAARKAEQGLHAIGVEPGQLDPHAKSADFRLKPDPTGHYDPIGRPGVEAQGNSAGSGPDTAGLSRAAKDAAADAADKAADLAGQAREKVSALADDVRGRLGGVADDAKSWMSGVHQENMRRIDDVVVRGSDRLDRGRGAVEQFVTENPLLVGVVSVAAGLLLGALLPRTRQEDRNIGPYADEVRDQGLRYAREFTSRGREFVETALDPDNIQAAAQKAAAAPDMHRDDDRTTHRS